MFSPSGYAQLGEHKVGLPSAWMGPPQGQAMGAMPCTQGRKSPRGEWPCSAWGIELLSFRCLCLLVLLNPIHTSDCAAFIQVPVFAGPPKPHGHSGGSQTSAFQKPLAQSWPGRILSSHHPLSRTELFRDSRNAVEASGKHHKLPCQSCCMQEG